MLGPSLLAYSDEAAVSVGRSEPYSRLEGVGGNGPLGMGHMEWVGLKGQLKMGHLEGATWNG